MSPKISMSDLRRKMFPDRSSPSDKPAESKDKSQQEPKRGSDEWSHVYPSDYKEPSETAVVQWYTQRREYLETSRLSTSSGDWILVDVGPNNEQQESEQVDPLTHPFVVVDPPPPSCGNGADDAADHSKQNDAPNHMQQNDASDDTQQNDALSTDYQGARSYWQQPLTLSSMTDAMLDLKASQRETRGTARSHFQHQQQQFTDMQKQRWQVEASQDRIEQHIDQIKQARSIEDLQRAAEKKRQNVVNMRKYLGPNDGQDEDVSAELMNLREQGIMNARGKTAQDERWMAPANYGQPEMEHPKANWKGDFPYKTGTFIHRDVKPIFNENGVRIGWDHKHMPSYKRQQLAAYLKPKGETELLAEVGKLPVRERLPALASSEKFEQTVARKKGKGKEREVVPLWYTQQSIDELLERHQPLWDTSSCGHARHDSAAEGY